MNPKHHPDDFMVDAQGRHVPVANIDEVDLLRDQTVRAIVNQAQQLQSQMRDFKASAHADVQQFVDLSAERYGVSIGGKKGNLTLSSYDGTLSVKIQVSENIRFDERIQAAKQLIDECIHAWTEGSSSEVKALVEHAFQTDKEGKISIGRILGLTRLRIDDPKWIQAMTAIRDSMQVVDTATYLRVYRRDTPQCPWVAVPLDLAKL